MWPKVPSLVLEVALGAGEGELSVLLVELLPLDHQAFVSPIGCSDWPVEHLLLEALHQVLEAVIPRAVVHVVLTRVTALPADVAAVPKI